MMRPGSRCCPHLASILAPRAPHVGRLLVILVYFCHPWPPFSLHFGTLGTNFCRMLVILAYFCQNVRYVGLLVTTFVTFWQLFRNALTGVLQIVFFESGVEINPEHIANVFCLKKN